MTYKLRQRGREVQVIEGHKVVYRCDLDEQAHRWIAERTAAESPWPLHGDGRRKKIGEMTPDERRAVFAHSAARVKAEFEEPATQAALARYLGGTLDA